MHLYTYTRYTDIKCSRVCHTSCEPSMLGLVPTSWKQRYRLECHKLKPSQDWEGTESKGCFQNREWWRLWPTGVSGHQMASVSVSQHWCWGSTPAGCLQACQLPAHCGGSGPGGVSAQPLGVSYDIQGMRCFRIQKQSWLPFCLWESGVLAGYLQITKLNSSP